MGVRSESRATYLPQTVRWPQSPSRVPRSAEYDEVIAKIRRLANMSADWDSYGGHEVPEGARRQALTFLTTMLAHLDDVPPAPAVGPVPDDGLLLRWLTDNKEIELVFFASGGEYTVRDRRTSDVLDEGEIGRPESVLRDVIGPHVAAR